MQQEARFLPHAALQQLIDILQEQGYSCVGPQVQNGAIVYDLLTRTEQLPWGMRDHQAPGKYHLEKIPEQLAFSWANGPQAIKPLLFKSHETAWKVVRDSAGKLIFEPAILSEPPKAIFGARACDIAAMLIQDKVFIDDKYVDKPYQQRRESLFVIAVNCTYSSANCFCVSAGCGPEVTQAFDLLLTELENGFIFKVGSERGQVIAERLPLTLPSAGQLIQASEKVEYAARSQSKRLPFDNSSKLQEVLFANLEHPRWAEVADRCLSCGNCTAVCPTCFCQHESDNPNINGSECSHDKQWDSCFTADHSYVGGEVVRDDTRKRYRQWLTHKVGSWFEQFGSSGCVGCGRCVTWCPVGIDITEELAAITGDK